MLNLFVHFMKYRFFLLIAFLLVSAQDAPSIAITNPISGQAINGQAAITGTTNIPGFASSQLDFSYASDPTDTWFAIQSSTQPVENALLATWDTTLITDGEYVLRLRVSITDGTFVETKTQVRVQNDSPLPTPTVVVTPTSTQAAEDIPTPFLVTPAPTPTRTPRPLPTPLPVNEVTLNRSAIYSSLARGVLVILGLFALAGVILRFRRY